jgi:hypothetical protein
MAQWRSATRQTAGSSCHQNQPDLKDDAAPDTPFSLEEEIGMKDETGPASPPGSSFA